MRFLKTRVKHRIWHIGCYLHTKMNVLQKVTLVDDRILTNRKKHLKEEEKQKKTIPMVIVIKINWYFLSFFFENEHGYFIMEFVCARSNLD